MAVTLSDSVIQEIQEEAEMYTDGVFARLVQGVVRGYLVERGYLERANPQVMNHFRKNLAEIGKDFDFCIIDTPPSLGLRMTAALVVAEHVLSPIELEEYSIDRIKMMLQTIFGVKQKFNPKLNFLGMLPNRFNSRSERQKATFANLVKGYSNLLIPAKIGFRSSIPEALSEGVPAWKLKKTSAVEAGKEFKEAFAFIFDKIGGVKV